MKSIKISGKTPEQLKSNIVCALNIGSLIASRGHLPNEKGRENSSYWWLYKDGKDGWEGWDLYPNVNNYWVYIDKKSETSMQLRFHYRYDDKENTWVSTVVNAIKLAFGDEVELL